jgi:anthranilate 1,2-dioxygenase large subunit
MISNEDGLDPIAIPTEWKADRLSRVPYWVFQREDVYAREQKRLFRGRVWNYLCLEVEIPEIGDYVATYAGDTPVVVTRGNDGQIYAFENRCSHRGSLLALKDRGNVRSFTCVYHAWTYSLEGDLTVSLSRMASAAKGAWRRPSVWRRMRRTNFA